MKRLILLLICAAVLGADDRSQSVAIPDSLQAKRALLMLRRIAAYQQYITPFDNELAGLESVMRKACQQTPAHDIQAAHDGAVECVPVPQSPPEGKK